MRQLVRYLSHPQVQIDSKISVPDWGLNQVGRNRVADLVAADCFQETSFIVSSAEKKAIETAEPIASSLGVTVLIREDMHENDRSATGFLPPDEFESVADQFFAMPHMSIRGWEKAIDAQNRIVTACDTVLCLAPQGDVLIVGHGGVGTLLLCFLLGVPIDRCYDQGVNGVAGGGNYFSFERTSRSILHSWQAMEELPLSDLG